MVELIIKAQKHMNAEDTMDAKKSQDFGDHSQTDKRKREAKPSRTDHNPKLRITFNPAKRKSRRMVVLIGWIQYFTPFDA